MPRRTTKSTTTTTTATEDVAVAVSKVDEEKILVETKNEEVKDTPKRKVVEPLNDYDEIEVVSLIPNVSYKDNKTGDMYEWIEAGHIEYMTVDTLKNMWRNHKGYFRNMWLKPNDNRIVIKFGLTNLFEKYEFLMDESNYTKANIDKVCEAISNTPNGLKFAICNRVKELVITGKLSDASVIKTLEKRLNLDLISFL